MSLASLNKPVKADACLLASATNISEACGRDLDGGKCSLSLSARASRSGRGLDELDKKAPPEGEKDDLSARKSGRGGGRTAGEGAELAEVGLGARKRVAEKCLMVHAH